MVPNHQWPTSIQGDKSWESPWAPDSAMAFRTTWHPFRKRRPAHGGMPIASFLVGYGPGKTCRCTILTYIYIQIWRFLKMEVPPKPVVSRNGHPETPLVPQHHRSHHRPFSRASQCSNPRFGALRFGTAPCWSWTLAKQFKNGIFNYGYLNNRNIIYKFEFNELCTCDINYYLTLGDIT